MLYWFINENAMILGIVVCGVIALLGVSTVLLKAYCIKGNNNKNSKECPVCTKHSSNATMCHTNSEDTLKMQEHRLKIVDTIMKVVDTVTKIVNIFIKIFKH